MTAGITSAPGGHGAAAVPVPDLSGPINIGKQLPAPLSTTQCQAEIGIRCYTPLQYHTAYDLNPLYRSGITGAGPDDRDRRFLRLADDRQ